MTSTSEQRYVAELRIPTYFYQEGDIRESLPNTQAFEITKGYWSMRPLPGDAVVDGQAAFTLTISFACPTLRDAEERALKAGKTFSSLVSGFAAHPAAHPELVRISVVDVAERLISQTNYWYGPKLLMLSGFSQVTQHRFQRYMQQVTSMEDMDRYRLQSAIHWYVNSLSSVEPTASIVSAWTGLEYIGKMLSDKFHLSGIRAPCDVCGNNPSTTRDRNDRKIAGIEHVFSWIRQLHHYEGDESRIEGIIASDLVEDFDVKTAESLRNDIVHGLKDVTFLEERCKEVRRHLSHVLNASIQNVMADLVPSGVLGDYEIRPEGRDSVKFEAALPRQPFYGGWVEGFRVSIERADSPQIPVIGWAGTGWDPDVYPGPVESRCREVFDRGSDIYEEADESLLTGIPKWDDRPGEPPWE